MILKISKVNLPILRLTRINYNLILQRAVWLIPSRFLSCKLRVASGKLRGASGDCLVASLQSPAASFGALCADCNNLLLG